MLIGIEEDAAAAARITLPPLSVVENAVTVGRGMAFIVATRGMRLESEEDLLGDTVRLPTLGLEEGTPLATAVRTEREGV